MGRIFYSDFCLSGQCIFREYSEAVLTARLVSDENDKRNAERRANELLAEVMRLLDEDGLMR